MDYKEISKLQKWHNSQEAFPTLIAQARGLRTSATDFAVDYVEILRANRIPVIWVLPHTNIFDENTCSLSEILLVLVMQILDLNPRVLLEGTFPVSIHHFQDIVSQESKPEDRAFNLLARCLEGVDQLYILIDMTLINATVNGNSARASTFLRRLQLVLSSRPGGGIKMVLASWKSAAGQTKQQGLENSPQIYVDGPLAGLSRRRLNRSNRILSIGQATLGRSLYLA